MKLIRVTLVSFIAVAVLTGGIMFFLGKDDAGSASDQALSAEELAELSVDTDSITTNLASPNHYAVVQFNIQLSSVEAKEEAAKRTAEIRAAVIATVAGLTKEELTGTDGIATLEQEISAKLDGIIQKGKVERVLVTEFKVQ
ncbi:flagellar basal body-associated FliL family protein [Planococcus salinus]|nr:flagellar basal body-associated FliL family protein [Planococcus salinus]